MVKISHKLSCLILTITLWGISTLVTTFQMRKLRLSDLNNLSGELRISTQKVWLLPGPC